MAPGRAPHRPRIAPKRWCRVIGAVDVMARAVRERDQIAATLDAMFGYRIHELERLVRAIIDELFDGSLTMPAICIEFPTHNASALANYAVAPSRICYSPSSSPHREVLGSFSRRAASSFSSFL
jgi:hypothetical protein